MYVHSSGAFYDIQKSGHILDYVHGLFGSGKTTLIVAMAKIGIIPGNKVLCGTGSNAGAEQVNTVVCEKYPKLGCAMVHSLHVERRAMRRAPKDPNAADPGADDSGEPEAVLGVSFQEMVEERKLFDLRMIALQKNKEHWAPHRRERPNLHTTSLHICRLQNAGLIDHDIDGFNTTIGDPHKDFRESLQTLNFDDPDSFKAHLGLEDTLVRDTLEKLPFICATLSNCASAMIIEAIKTGVLIIDEGGQSKELENLLPWLYGHTTIRKVIIVGDPQQLVPTVKSLSKNREDHVEDPHVENPMARQVATSVVVRYRELGYQTARLTENFRMTEGLEVFSNDEFYEGEPSLEQPR